jgi:hypothetical protein
MCASKAVEGGMRLLSVATMLKSQHEHLTITGSTSRSSRKNSSRPPPVTFQDFSPLLDQLRAIFDIYDKREATNG